MHARNRILPIVLFLILTGYPFVKFGFVQVWDYVGGDWEIFYRASRNLAAGMSPYSFGERNPDVPEGGRYVYPPFFARLLVPLTVLSPLAAKRVYVYSILILYLLLLWPRKREEGAHPLQRAIGIVFLLGWGPAIDDFRVGQSNFIPFFCFVIAMRLLQAEGRFPVRKFGIDREFSAGAICGIACSIKLTPLILVPVLAVTARWKMAAGILLGFTANSFLWGPRDCLVFFSKVLPSLSGFVWDSRVYCLHTFAVHNLPRVVGNGWLSQSTLVCGLVYLCLLFFIHVKRKSFATADLIPIGCYLSVLFGGLWFNHYTLALLPILFVTPQLADAFVRRPTRSPKKRFPLDPSFLRSVAFFAVLTPCFTYWGLLSDLFLRVNSRLIVPHSLQVFFGNTIAFAIFLNTVMQNGSRNRPKDPETNDASEVNP